MQPPLFLLLLALSFLPACDPGPIELKLVAPSSDLDLEIAHDLASFLNQGSSFRLEITSEQYLGEEALDILQNGDADIALVSNYLPFREGITTVIPLYASVLHVAYRDGRDPSNPFTLLDQAIVHAGRQGSASRLMLERLIAHMRIPTDIYTYADHSKAARDADPDIAVAFAPISPQLKSVFDGYRLFSFGSPGEIGTGSTIDSVALLNPPLRPFVIPANTYGSSNPGPIVTVAVDKLLVSRDDLDASAVYDLIGEIRRSRPALSATRPGLFDRLAEGLDLSRSTFVLHAGTQDFLQREEPTVYERYSGIAEVLVTLIIALVSAIFAGLRILKMRRKNRIDRFYSAAIEIRDTIGSESTDEDRTRAQAKVRTLQNTAFDQLVDEKLAADESFRIFITLSNDILHQLNQFEATPD